MPKARRSRPQGPARELQPSEFLPPGAVSESKRTFPSREGRGDFILPVDNSHSLQGVNAREPCVYFWRRRCGIRVNLEAQIAGQLCYNSAHGEDHDRHLFV